MLTVPGALIAAVAFSANAVPAGSPQDPGGFAGVSEAPKVVKVVAHNTPSPLPVKPTYAPDSVPAVAPPLYTCWNVPYPSYVPSDPANYPPDKGAWVKWACSGDFSSLNLADIPPLGMAVWLPNAAQTAAPVAVAQQAEKLLRLPDPVLGSSPAAASPQFVNFPTWIFMDGASWHPLSATAAVPGVQVTATATPVVASWSMGDGSTVVCKGPGTVYVPLTLAASPSPTCGHVYRRSSVGQPGGRFTVTAVTTWRVTWTGAGQSGTLPDLTTGSSIAVRVAESQALVTSAY